MKAHAPLFLLALAAGAIAAEPTYYTNVPRDVIGTTPDLSLVAKFRFFSSADGGKSWQLLKEIALAPGTQTPPQYEFRPQSDGDYLIATCAIFRDPKQQSEADPLPGVIPKNVVHLVIDTFKPSVTQVEAGLDHVQKDQAVITVSWSASDSNFGPDPVTVEASSDGGATWPLALPGPAIGQLKITEPLTAQSRTVLVRVTAKDLAGNITVAEPRTVALPPPPDPTVELVKAVSSLPSVGEITKSDQPATPPTTAATGTTPTATASAPAGQTSAALTPGADTPVATSDAPAGHPDIVAPHATLADPADGALVAGTSFEASYQAHLGTHPSSDPAAPTTASNESDAPQAIPPATAATAEATSSMPFLPNPEAETVLEQARDQAKAGDQAGALVTYRRLQQSGQAVVAIPEELALLHAMGDEKGVVATVEALPPEFVGDEERLDEGRSRIALGQQAQGLATLSRVHAGAPQAREAMWLIAGCFTALGHAEQAHHVLDNLSKGDDQWAQKARAALEPAKSKP